jgi:thiol-disulfide isomerase/thioredoxin
MISRRSLVILTLAAGITAAIPGFAAAPMRPFTKADFAAAQKSGKPVLVHIHADWCPTCKVQEQIVSGLREDPKFKELVVFKVDFDGQKDIVSMFGARTQSTLVVFKGTAEAGRSVGDTNKATIAAMLAKAL